MNFKPKFKAKPIHQVFQEGFPIDQFDVEPLYTPQLKTAYGLIALAINQICGSEARLFSSISAGLSKLKNHDRSFGSFKNTFKYLQDSRHRYTNNGVEHINHGLTYWHIAIVVVLTSFHFEKLLKEGKQKTIDLSDQKVLQAMELDTSVLLVNFLATKLFEPYMKELHSILNSGLYSIDDFFKFSQSQINECEKLKAQTL